jgi:hypothetical protein
MTDWKTDRDASVDEGLAFARTVRREPPRHRFGGATKIRAHELGCTAAGRNQTARFEFQSPVCTDNLYQSSEVLTLGGIPKSEDR